MSIVCLFGRLGLLHSDVVVWLESTATAAMASRRSHMRVLPLGTLCLTTSAPWLILSSSDKKHSYRRVTARCVLSVVILPIATQQCRNYLYDKSWPNWWYEVGGLVGDNVSWTMCTQPWHDRVGSHCLGCHKQTDDLLWRNFLSPQCRNCSRDPDHAHLGNTHSSQD